MDEGEMARVYIVSLEWNDPPSEVTGDTGIVGVFDTEAAADTAAHDERMQWDRVGSAVWQFSTAEGRYCAFCGEKRRPLAPRHHGEESQAFAECDNHACNPERATADDDTGRWCDQCGAELTDNGECNNDHDEWDIDVHVTAHDVIGAPLTRSRRYTTPSGVEENAR